mmetsp:Transcript_19154/g.40954  ORF Transcript_19154/g.40954 Transcript_19154/m.40954 type:complete len:80 (-) Transcript_19154:331-570(-)
MVRDEQCCLGDVGRRSGFLSSTLFDDLMDQRRHQLADQCCQKMVSLWQSLIGPGDHNGQDQRSASVRLVEKKGFMYRWG